MRCTMSDPLAGIPGRTPSPAPLHMRLRADTFQAVPHQVHPSVPNMGDVILVTGPMGSGKSTLAQNMAQKLDWDRVSEDTYWVGNGWEGFRSADQEQVVQRQVIDHLLAVCRSGRSVVVEFILYAEPPNPLSAYENALDDNSVAYEVIVLKPSVAEVMRRIAVRGRAGDLQRLVERELDVEHQMQVLESGILRSYRFVDSSDLSVEEATWACLKSLGRFPS